MKAPARWTQKSLSDYIVLQRGFDLPLRNRVSGPFKVLSSGEASGWHNEGPVKGPGFVVGRATNIGRPTWSDEDYWPLNTVLYAKDFMGNDPKFAYYWFLWTDLTAYNSGSVQPMLNRNYIANVPILVPPIDEQRGIAATLGALDDKIESNRRAIEVAKNLSRALYKRPNERASVAASDLLIPVLGGTPQRGVPDYWSGNIPWASAKDVAASDSWFVLHTAETISESGVANSAAKVLPTGTIVITARGTVGALARLAAPMAFNQSCYALVAVDGISTDVLFLALEDAVQRIRDLGHGTVFNTVNMATFSQIELDWPVMNRSDQEGVEALFELILDRLQEIERLTSLRDTLLPELLSSRIRVPEASGVVS